MEFLARALTLSSFALLGSAAPAAEASLFNGVVNTANTVGVSVSSVVSAIPKPSTILSTASDAPGATVNAVYGLLEGYCGPDWKCTITVNGTIESLLVDGNKYAGNASVSGWCDAGHCYGSADITTTASAPFKITCDTVTGSKACTATIYGAVNVIFSNGPQLELWGWLTPTGYCSSGTCYASLNALGDPMY